MTELVEIAKTLNDWRFLAALCGVALAAVTVAVAIRLYIHWRREGAVPVKLRVVDVKEENNGGEATYKPEFVVVSGIYKGQRYVSEVGTSPPDHAVGDEVDGHYQRASGVITSAKTMGDLKKISNACFFAASVAAACALYISSS